MSITTNYYNPSVNIIRDANKSIKYIPTPNAKLAYREIIKQYSRGTRSFNIVGAYGTGKSSFLLALEKTLNSKNDIFRNASTISEVKSFEVIPFVGDYRSVIFSFAERLGLKGNKFSNEDIITEINDINDNLKKEGKGLAIFVDEFGKYLEFASKNNPESELYFVQQLAENVNDIDKEILLITTLHQGFNSYSRNLTKYQQQEWDKVKGRFVEITFNEPVEQLLLLAAENLNNPNNKIDKNISALFGTIQSSHAFPLRDYLDINTCKKLLPFDILAASILTLSLQRYGQNQRSLFSFIDSNSYLSILEYNKSENPFYNLTCVYDYLIFHYYSFLSTKYNPDYTQWASIRTSLERVESVFTDTIKDVQKIIKSIGLLSIFSSKGAIIDKKFLIIYSQISLGIKNPEKIIKELETNKIILYSNYNNRYKLFEGTDLNIELAIDEAGNIVQKIGNVVDYLLRYFDFPFIFAKETFYKLGTPRFFAFELSDEPINKVPEDEIDGYINIVFSESIDDEDIKHFTSDNNEPILYGLYRNTSELKKLLFEIEKIKKVIEDNQDDKFALKELNAILEHQKNLLNHFILDSLYSELHINWYFRGKQVVIRSSKELNRFLSSIIKEIYFGTPILKNELFNRTKISSAVSVARKNLFLQLINNCHQENLGFDDDKYPPEKTIYLSLIKETGIHRFDITKYILEKPTDKSFSILWETGCKFIDGTKNSKRRISELVEIYLSKPIKLKQGFIDFWLPLFLYINRSKYAIYEDGIFIPEITIETLELISKRPLLYEIKAFDLDENKLRVFNNYRMFLNQIEEKELGNQNFIETIKPFLVFYKSIPPYTKSTTKIGKKAISLRDAIANAKDPEKAFFEDFPKAIGYNINDFLKNAALIEDYIIQLKSSIQELNSAYDNLINRIESFILKKIIGNSLGFPEYKNELVERFGKIKKYMLSSKQKAFLQRIKSPLDDRKSWLNSLTYAIIDKPLENITDEEEKIICDLLIDKVRELDNLCELSISDIDEKNEDVYKIEITSFVKGLEKKLVRLPKPDTNEIKTLEKQVKLILKANDKDLTIALLVKLLQEQLKNE